MLMKYELRKLFGGKFKWLLVLIFLTNFLLYYLYLIPSVSVEEEQELYESLVCKTGDRETLERELELIKAEIQKEEEEMRSRIESGNTDYVPGPKEEARSNVIRELQEEYREVLGFYDFSEELEERSSNLLEFSIFSKENSFSKRNIEKTSQEFAGIKGLWVVPLNGVGLRQMQDFLMTDLFMLIAICMFSFQLFGKEGRSGMQRLLNTTVGGGGKLRAVQLSTISICVIVYALVLYGSNIWQTWNFVGLPELGAEIHGIQEFRNIPFPCTVGMYLGFSILWKAAASCVASMLFQAVVYRLSGAKLAWVLLGAGTAVSFLCWFFLPANPVLKVFRYINLIGMFDTGEIIGNYQNLNLFSYPVGLRTASIVAGVIVLILCAVVTVFFGPSVFRIPERRKREKLPVKCSKSIFLYEWYKNLSKQKIWLIFAVLVLWVCYDGVTTVSQVEYLTREEYSYEQLADEFIGKKDEELAAAIEELAGQEEFSSGEQIRAAQRILQQGNYLLESQREDSYFVSEQSWEKIFFDQDKELENFLLFVLCITFSVSGIFQFESKSRMKTLIRPTVNSKRVYMGKLGVVCVESAVYGMLIWGGTYLSILSKYEGLENPQWQAYCLQSFQDFPIELSIKGMLILFFVQRVLASVLIGVILFLLAQVLTVSVYFIAVSALGFMLPAVVLLIANMDYINPLILVLRNSVGPFLQYIYIFSSWFTVYRQYPVVLYPALCAAAAGLSLYGFRRWKGQ